MARVRRNRGEQHEACEELSTDNVYTAIQLMKSGTVEAQ